MFSFIFIPHHVTTSLQHPDFQGYNFWSCGLFIAQHLDAYIIVGLMAIGLGHRVEFTLSFFVAKWSSSTLTTLWHPPQYLLAPFYNNRAQILNQFTRISSSSKRGKITTPGQIVKIKALNDNLHDNSKTCTCPI